MQGIPSRFIAEMKLDEAVAKGDPRERLKKLRADLAARMAAADRDAAAVAAAGPAAPALPTCP